MKKQIKMNLMMMNERCACAIAALPLLAAPARTAIRGEALYGVQRGTCA